MTITHQECGPFILDRQRCVYFCLTICRCFFWGRGGLFGERLQPLLLAAKGETVGRRIRLLQRCFSFLFGFNDATFTSLLKGRYAAGSFWLPSPGHCSAKIPLHVCEAFFFFLLLAWLRSLWWSGAASLTLFSFPPPNSPVLFPAAFVARAFPFLTPTPPSFLFLPYPSCLCSFHLNKGT